MRAQSNALHNLIQCIETFLMSYHATLKNMIHDPDKPDNNISNHGKEHSLRSQGQETTTPKFMLKAPNVHSACFFRIQICTHESVEQL